MYIFGVAISELKSNDFPFNIDSVPSSPEIRRG